MFNNVGTTDRFVRFAIAGLLLYLGLGVYGGSTLGTGFLIAAAIAAFTALLGSCALYGLLGINTRKANSNSQ